MDKKRIMFVRTYRDVGAGGPVPPLGLLYLASAIRKKLGDNYCNIKLVDTGLIGGDLNILKKEIANFMPHIIGISTISCEVDLMYKIARLSKTIDKNTVILAGGPHATIAYEEILEDRNIDFAVIGEGENTVSELLIKLEKKQDVCGVKGISYIRENRLIQAEPREYIENLDQLPFPAWDLIDYKLYAKHPNWNGNLREKYYMPILTSRGCPYSCTYCHNTLGKGFRARSVENVLSEIDFLFRNYKIKEFHIFDDVFNLDADRVRKFCQLILDSKQRFSFAFPNGLRIDIMNKEIIGLLRKIGTYKINYAIESVSSKIQDIMKKNLGIEKAEEIIKDTNKAGIITTGYFMLGFPGETEEEILKTIKFAIKSDFDLAYFFKVTAFPGTPIFELVKDKIPASFRLDYYKEAYFYSRENSAADVPVERLNRLILYAQKEFYLKPKRISRLIFKSPYRVKTLKSLFCLWIKILVSSIELSLSDSMNKN